MINEPPNCPQRELDMVREMHAKSIELARGRTDIIILLQNPGIGRPRGDTESIVILSQPIDLFSEEAQETGKYYRERNALVQMEKRLNPAISSSKSLCTSCWNVLIYLNPGRYTKKRSNSEEGSAVIHHENLASLEASATTGCGICKPLHERIHRSFSFLTRYDDLRLECSWLATSETEARRTIFFSATQRSQQRMEHNYMNLYWLQTYAHEVYSPNFEVPMVDTRDRGDSTDSLFCQELAHHWLQQCRQNTDSSHNDCQGRDVDWLPARLLDVESAKQDHRLRLRTRDEIKIPEDYMTLSYVWGTQGHADLPLLNSQNLEQRKKNGLELTILPQTFRDVVVLAERLAVKYLWIDCLCILQDSNSDWQREADSMSLTYRNALLNISADAFPDPFGGLFVQRDTAPLLPWKLGIGEQGWYLTTLPQWEFTDAESTASYWRAWIYRERQLAPRVLHFGPKQIAWECCSPRHCSEKYPGGAPFALHDATYGGESKYQVMMRDAKAVKNTDNRSTIHTSWELLCNFFSQRGLAKLSDMPIIISSLALDFASILPHDKYMAGLWQSRLPHCLLWTTRDIREGDLTPNKEMTSWSWLRLCNKIESQYNLTNMPILRVTSVELNNELPFYSPQRAKRLTVFGIWRRLRFEYLCNLREMTPNEYGCVEDIYLDDDDDKRVLGVSYNKDDGSKCIVKYDQHIMEYERTYYCLFVTICQSQNQRRIRGLLLQQVQPDEYYEKETPYYERLGTIEFLDEMALRVRYRVPANIDGEHTRWTALEHEFRYTQANDTEPEDIIVDASDVEPSNLYRYDIDGDYSWLHRLEPRLGILI